MEQLPKTHTSHDQDDQNSTRKDAREISSQLQEEINGILGSVNEHELYAEFREEEIFDLKDGNKNDYIRYTLEDRITEKIKMPHKPSKTVTFLSDRPKKIGKKISTLIYYLFKPLEY